MTYTSNETHNRSQYSVCKSTNRWQQNSSTVLGDIHLCAFWALDTSTGSFYGCHTGFAIHEPVSAALKNGTEVPTDSTAWGALWWVLDEYCCNLFPKYVQQKIWQVVQNEDLATRFSRFVLGPQDSSGAAALSKAQALLAAASRTCCWLLFVTLGFHLFRTLQVASSCCCLPHDSVLSCLVSKGRNHNPNLPTAWHVSGMAGKRGAPFFNVQMWADCVCRSSNGDSNWKAVASKASSTCFCKY